MVVTFDIADGSFDFYTHQEWRNQLAEWRAELEAGGYEGSEALDDEETVDMMYGEELFFSYFTPTIVLN